MHPLSTFCKSLSGFLLCLFLVGVKNVNAQTIIISSDDYQVDQVLKLIVCNKMPDVPASPSTLTLVFDRNYSFSNTGAVLQTGKEYTLGSSSGTYKLFFTTFPIISLTTNGVAISEDDNRTKGTVSIATNSGALFTSSMGIRVRGNTSRLNPKKSYNMELWKDADGNEEFETSLLGMREDSKWLLQAMYSEPLRVNNVASWAIWLKMHQLYYSGQEPDARAGIRTRYCDVFVNNSYNGVYLIAEDLDRKQLKIKKTKDNGDLRGELYKSGAKTDAAFFTSVFNKNNLPPYDNTSATWCGYEMDYPKLPFWNNLSGLANFINKSSDVDFKNEIGKRFRLDNLIDCFLFLNSIGTTDDNFGNNQFFGRYKENEPYILLPWDFDVSFGNVNGVMTTVAENVRMNGFFYRLLTLNPDGFRSRMRKRWFALRQGDLTTANFKKNLTDNITLLTNEGAYKREELRWPATLRLAEQTAILTWIDNRMTFLDQYFVEFPEEDPSAVAITLQNFTGQAAGVEKQLQWTTSSEKDASRFEVEFSTNGLTFTKVGQVAATGNSSSEKSYGFTHSDASPVAYYRLKIFNKVDLFKYSDAVLVGSCPSPPVAPTVSASLTTITTGQSTVLKATGCANTVLWNTGQSGTQLTVNPATTTTYQARCRQAAGCESAFSAPITINVNVPTAYDGYLTTVSCTVISGWAWDGNKPNKPVVVEILEGQNVISFVVADIFRTDLKAAGKGNGLHAYAFEPPQILFDNKPHTLSARVQGSTVALKQAPKTVTCPYTNVAPLAPAIAPLSASIDVIYSRTLPMFFDKEYGSVFYGLTGLPNGLAFEPITRKITGIPTASGAFSLTYTANDGQSATPILISMIVSNTAVTNQPPQAPGVSPLSATVNAVFSTTLPQFTDTDPLTYSLGGLPSGLDFASVARSISGAPVASGTFSLTYAASDGQNTTTTYISLVVSNPVIANQAPQPPTAAPLSATVNTAFTTTLPAFTDTDPLSYTLSGLPNGLGFTPGTRVITGTPLVSGTFSLTYSANDGKLSTPVYLSMVVSNSATVAPTATVTGNFEGYLDKVECGTIRGWVWDRNKPNTPLMVEFFANGTSIGTANANIFRQDLKDAGKGNGNHVYSFPTPSSVKTGATFQISAKVQNSTYTLSWSPKALICPSGSRLSSDEDSEPGNSLTVWPNPSDGNFEIGYRLDGGKPGELSVVDASGRRWYQKTVEGEGAQRQKIKVTSGNGIFLIQLQQGNKTQSKKISIRE